MKKTSVNVFNKDPSVDNVSVVYFLSDTEGKEIKIQALREDTELCTSDDDHSIITVTSKPKSPEQNLPISDTPPLKLVFVDIHELNRPNYLDFIFLPEISPSKPYYSEKICIFKSCKNPPKKLTIIIYPDLVYSASITFSSKGKIDGASLSAIYGKSKPVKVDLDTFNKIVDFLTWFSDIEGNLQKLFSEKKSDDGPFSFEVNTPSIVFNCNWKYNTSPDYTKIGGLYHFDISLTPLFGGKITVHILEFVVSLAANAILPAGGQAIVNSISNFVDMLRDYINGRFHLDLDIYIDLIIEGNFNLSLVTDIDTSTPKDNTMNFTGDLEVTGTLTAGATVAAKVFMIGASGTTGINILGGVKFIAKDVSFYSELTFEGLTINVVLEIDIGLTTLKYEPPDWTFADETVIWSGEYCISKKSTTNTSSLGDSSKTTTKDGGSMNNIANF